MSKESKILQQQLDSRNLCPIETSINNKNFEALSLIKSLKKIEHRNFKEKLHVRMFFVNFKKLILSLNIIFSIS